jgi:hypothetical protein
VVPPRAVLDIWENEIIIEAFNKYIDSLPERLEKGQG